MLDSGEECFIASLVDEMRSNTDYLFKLQRQLSGKDVETKLEILEQVKLIK